MEKISRNNNLEKVTHKKVTHEEMENLNSPLNIKEIESVSIYIFIYLKLKYSWCTILHVTWFTILKVIFHL